MDPRTVHRQRGWITISEYNRQNIQTAYDLGTWALPFRYLLSVEQEMIPVRNAVDTQEQYFMTNDDLLLPIPDHLWPVWLYLFFFCILSHKRHHFRGKLLNIKCVVFLHIFCLSSETSYTYSNVKYIGLHEKNILFLSDFNKTLIFSRFSKNSPISNFIKTCPVRADLFHADGRKDRHDEANSHFSQFYKRA